MIELVKCNSTKGYLFSLGIGSGVSAELVTGVADAGNGVAEFVSNSSEINSKVVSLLKASLEKKLFNFWIEYNKEHVDKIVPEPTSINFLREN